MRILIDIGHPAHVHYFKHTIRRLEDKGHRILIVARNRKFVKELLEINGLTYIDRGTGSNSRLGKFLYMFKADFIILKAALKFKPDLFLSFSSPYAAQVSFLLRKNHIALNDTEHSDAIYSVFTYPFCSAILTPDSFQDDLGPKQIKFKNVVEGLYLQRNLFEIRDIRHELGLGPDEKYVVLRLVSFNAHHDFHQHGISIDTQRELVSFLEENFKVFISSEDDLPDEFLKYSIPTRPEDMHQVLAGAHLFIGESATMASESSMLGTFAVYVNSSPITCNTKIQQEFGLAKYFSDDRDVIEFVKTLLEDKELKKNSVERSNLLQSEFIDATKFLVWFIENFPESQLQIKRNPELQNNFV